MNGAFLFALAMEEKARVAAGKHVGGGAGGRFDLDAARAEIGLRLACLRTAGSGGEISGGVE
ncbi:hypothetical protein E2K80_03060 [Rhodophyticola sp. CCM32]|nr:hypothetical protein E2K80_03060 [Rhodophyticola sp. CCM32]